MEKGKVLDRFFSMSKYALRETLHALTESKVEDCSVTFYHTVEGVYKDDDSSKMKVELNQGEVKVFKNDVEVQPTKSGLYCPFSLQHVMADTGIYVKVSEVKVNGNTIAGIGKNYWKIFMEIFKVTLEQGNRLLVFIETGKRIPITLYVFKGEKGELVFYRRVKTAKESRVTLFKNSENKIKETFRMDKISGMVVYKDSLTELEFLELQRLTALVKVDESQYRVINLFEEEEVIKC